MFTVVIFDLITNTIVDVLSNARLSNILGKRNFDIHNIGGLYILGMSQFPLCLPRSVSSLHLTHE